MTKPKILNETAISIAELKNELEKIKKRDAELNFRVGKTEEYVQLFTLSESKANELAKKIEALDIPRMKKEIVLKFIDLAPKNAEEVKLILQGYGITVTQDNVKKIADIFSE